MSFWTKGLESMNRGSPCLWVDWITSYWSFIDITIQSIPAVCICCIQAATLSLIASFAFISKCLICSFCSTSGVMLCMLGNVKVGWCSSWFIVSSLFIEAFLASCSSFFIWFLMCKVWAHASLMFLVNMSILYLFFYWLFLFLMARV